MSSTLRAKIILEFSARDGDDVRFIELEYPNALAVNIPDPASAAFAEYLASTPPIQFVLGGADMGQPDPGKVKWVVNMDDQHLSPSKSFLEMDEMQYFVCPDGSVAIRCPRCKGRTETHKQSVVSENGRVTPSYVCGYDGCGAHCYLVLDGFKHA